MNGKLINKIEGSTFNSFSGIKAFDLNKENQIGLIDNKNIFFNFTENGKSLWKRKFDNNLISVNAYSNGWIIASEKNKFVYIDNDHLKPILIRNNFYFEILDFKIKNNDIYILTKNNLIFNGKINYSPN